MPPESRSGCPAAACIDLVQVYRSASGPVSALRGVSAEFPKGTVTVVMGRSGAGKSTLLRILACLERPTAGDLRIDGDSTVELTGRQRRRVAARRVGYVFQRPGDNLLDYLTVADHVRMALRMRGAGMGDVASLLDSAHLSHLTSRRPGALSAGEQQRLAFAMAVGGDTSLVVADEPTAELDPKGTDAIVDLLPALCARGQTLVISSHEPAVIEAADQVLVIRDGGLAARATRSGTRYAVIDTAGRVALPDEALRLFHGAQVRATVSDDAVMLEEP